jgi:hypothetical protein
MHLDFSTSNILFWYSVQKIKVEGGSLPTAQVAPRSTTVKIVITK